MYKRSNKRIIFMPKKIELSEFVNMTNEQRRNQKKEIDNLNDEKETLAITEKTIKSELLNSMYKK